MTLDVRRRSSSSRSQAIADDAIERNCNVCCNSAEERSSNLDDTLKSVKPWVTFAGGVLVVAVLYWAQAVLVPFALAILLTFVLTPPVTWLQRWVGRVPPCC